MFLSSTGHRWSVSYNSRLQVTGELLACGTFSPNPRNLYLGAARAVLWKPNNYIMKHWSGVNCPICTAYFELSVLGHHLRLQ